MSQSEDHVTAAHVPAWKRIGLKLKSDNSTVTTTEAANPNSNHAPNGSSATGISTETKASLDKKIKRKREVDGDSEAPRVIKKKSKQDRSASQATSTTGSSTLYGVTPETTKTADKSSAPKETGTQTRKRQKSVSFAADTKTDDGDSVQPLAVNEDIEAENTANGKKPKTTPETTTNDTTKDRNPKERKSKPQDRTHTAYLEYLQQFHTDKAGWKFNKSKQNDVLKNILNTYRIPSNYNEALVAYIHGLQGQGARNRLRDQAQQLLSELKQSTASQIPDDKEPDMTTIETRREAYQLAETHEIERLRGLDQPDAAAENEVHETAKRRRQQDERATLILNQALELDMQHLNLVKNIDQVAEKESEMSARAKKRLRDKGRIAAESSSDSSSSEEESSSEESSSESSSEAESSSENESSSDEESDSDDSGSGDSLDED